MTLPAQSLAERRLQLVQRSTAQRAALIADTTPLADKLAAARRIFRLATRALTIYALFRKPRYRF